MSIDIKAWLLRSNFFCFCIPVRAGFVVMSVLTFLLSGAISIIIWFELSHSYQLSSNGRLAFYLTGIVESLLFLASIAGFIGVVARKQLFVTTYTYFLYVHFVINLIVGIYFLVTVRANNRQGLVDECAEVFVNTSMESSCTRLMSVSTYVFIAIVAALLLLELYGVLIATRYVNRLRMQKRDDRSRRLGYFHALSKPERQGSRHTRQPSDNIELLRSQEGAGDLRYPEDAFLDIGKQDYMPVPTYDRELVPAQAPSSPLPPHYAPSDMGPSRRIRALPPRPVGSPTLSVVVQTPGDHQEGTDWPGGLPNPHELQPPAGEDELPSPGTAELSTAGHAALMDHATYMESIFTYPSPVASHSQRSLR